jgi:hypothetical protein
VATAKVQLEQLSQGDALQKSKGGGMRRWLSH